MAAKAHSLLMRLPHILNSLACPRHTYAFALTRKQTAQSVEVIQSGMSSEEEEEEEPESPLSFLSVQNPALKRSD